MILPGLVSITFRKLKAEKIVSLTAEAGLTGIEWGGDIHVPHGDIKTAKTVKQMTLDAGLKVAAYGSYYRFDDQLVFEDVLETALALGAPLIRIWAGHKGSAHILENERAQIVRKSYEIAHMADEVGVKVAYEYHGNTLTDTLESTVSLLEEVNHPNIYSYWQPLTNHSLKQRLNGIKNIGKWLTNIHVYHWDESSRRLPLAAGEHLWTQYMELIHRLPEQRYAMIEFVRSDDPDQFLKDAEYLCELLAGFN